MRQIKTYKTGWPFDKERKKAEAKMFADGWEIESEEYTKQFDGKKGCCLLIIFLPLFFLAWEKTVKVTYIKNDNNNSEFKKYEDRKFTGRAT